MNVQLAENAITSRTKAIIPVHLTGKPVNMDAVVELARKAKISIIEDCAQAVGSTWRDRPVGTFGIGAFSLHPLKNLAACGDGGFITTQSKELYENLRKLRNHGLRDRDHLEMVGYNSRLDEIQAAILNVKFRSFDQVIEQRRSNASNYIRELTPLLGHDLLGIPTESNLEFGVYHTFVIRVSRRDQLQKFLADRGIETKIHYPFPIHLQPPYRTPLQHLPKTELYASQILSLPIHQNLRPDQLNFVTQTIKEFIGTSMIYADKPTTLPEIQTK